MVSQILTKSEILKKWFFDVVPSIDLYKFLIFLYITSKWLKITAIYENIMEIKDRFRSIVIISFFMELIIICILLPIFPYITLRNFLLGYISSLLLDFFVLVNIMFLYIYFIIRPIKTLKGNIKLAIVTMIFGGILVVFHLNGIVLLVIFNFLWMYLDGLLIYLVQDSMVYSLFLIPGVILIILGRNLRNNIRIENRS